MKKLLTITAIMSLFAMVSCSYSDKVEEKATDSTSASVDTVSVDSTTTVVDSAKTAAGTTK
jgi:hypothetical protein